MMEQLPKAGGSGFRQNIREILKNEPVVLVQMGERNFPKFEGLLKDLSLQSQSEDGMLPITGNLNETTQEWIENTKGLWVFGPKVGDISTVEGSSGFVSVYEPEHLDKINEWQAVKGKRVYEKGQVLELSSFVKDVPGSAGLEDSATKLALDKVFNGLGFKDVRAVSVWITHDEQNQLNSAEAARTIALGGKKLGSMRYDAGEMVDSTCFVIPRQAFLDTLTGGHK